MSALIFLRRSSSWQRRVSSAASATADLIFRCICLMSHGIACVVRMMRDLILPFSKSSIYSTKPMCCQGRCSERAQEAGQRYLGQDDQKSTGIPESKKPARRLVSLNSGARTRTKTSGTFLNSACAGPLG